MSFYFISQSLKINKYLNIKFYFYNKIVNYWILNIKIFNYFYYNNENKLINSKNINSN